MTRQIRSFKQFFRQSPFLSIAGIGALGLLLGYLSSHYVGLKPYAPISLDEKLTVCFTPNGQCQTLIVQAIDQAEFSIKMQTYSFTSKEIAKALLRAQERGVEIRILADRSQLTAKYSQIPKLKNSNVPVLIDRVPGIAHNKVIIIDDQIILTGSYNWTNAAEHRNAENLLRIQDPTIAAYYIDNWNKRAEVAVGTEENEVGLKKKSLP
jgi:phospholipase D